MTALYEKVKLIKVNSLWNLYDSAFYPVLREEVLMKEHALKRLFESIIRLSGLDSNFIEEIKLKTFLEAINEHLFMKSKDEDLKRMYLKEILNYI